MIRKSFKSEQKNKINPKVKEVLTLLRKNIFPADNILKPRTEKLRTDEKQTKEYDEWSKYNTSRLKQMLKRLQNQKTIEIIENKNGHIVKITEKGRKRLLKYDIDDMALTGQTWDGKWRIIAYDIDESKRMARNYFRTILKKLEFLRLQKSMYLTPYKCEDEIEYVRQVFDIGDGVTILKVEKIENESAYKAYFGLS